MSAELTLVVPTYNEVENIQPLIDVVSVALKGVCQWEMIVVDDDSSDGTADLVREISRNDPRIRCLQRIGRKGLSSACIEGMLASSSPYLCVMDADLQHDESLLPKMLETLKSGRVNIVIGSRYMEHGSTGSLARRRVWISKIATRIGKLLFKQSVTDPMSGYFMLERKLYDRFIRRLSGKGFKILLDILISSGDTLRYQELPYIMRERSRGESKLSMTVVWEFFTLLVDKLLGRLFPVRFINFSIVGLSGVGVHLVVLWAMYRLGDSGFLPSQAVATLIAMTSNYFLNNYITYSDKRLKGVAMFYGLFSFYLACSFGALINLALADFMFERAVPWWIAGVSGAVAGAVWNYTVTAVFTWGKSSGTED